MVPVQSAGRRLYTRTLVSKRTPKYLNGKSWSGETGGNGKSELLIVELHWASVLRKDQFKGAMERGVRDRESLAAGCKLVLSRTGGECS